MFNEPIEVRHIYVTAGSTGFICENAVASYLRDGEEAHYTDISRYTQAGSESSVNLAANDSHYAPVNEHSTIYTKGILIRLTNITAGSTIAEIHVAGNKEGTLHTANSIFEQCVSKYGFCDKFAYDEENNTIRLPLHPEDSMGRHLIDTYHSGHSWYRLYDDGWCEQGGYIENIKQDSTTTVTLVKPYADNSYHVVTQTHATGSNNNGNNNSGEIYTRSTGSFILYTYNYTKPVYWQACGFVNLGDYEHQELNPYKYIVVAQSAKTELQVDLDNVTAEIDTMIRKSDLTEITSVVETFSSGYSWYRVYSDGWCEQGGQYTAASITINFLKPFIDTNYNIQTSVSDGSPTDSALTVCSWNNKTRNSVILYCGYNGSAQSTSPCNWVACGYIL